MMHWSFYFTSQTAYGLMAGVGCLLTLQILTAALSGSQSVQAVHLTNATYFTFKTGRAAYGTVHCRSAYVQLMVSLLVHVCVCLCACVGQWVGCVKILNISYTNAGPVVVRRDSQWGWWVFHA